MKKLTPLKAIRLKCLDCSSSSRKEVRECLFDGIREKACPLYHLRLGKGSRATLKSIRIYCLWCCNGQRKEVRLCPSVNCPLWKYRFGKRIKKPSLSLKTLTTEGVLEIN